MTAIQTLNLSKKYNTGKEALKGVDLKIEAGEVFGFLGPNGAGKTTMVKVLSGMLMPTGGSCTVMGKSPNENIEELHNKIGVLTEHAQMYNQITGFDNLLFYGEMFGLSKEQSRQRANELLEKLELIEAGNKKLGNYSTGMRQRLSFARALMHRPELLFLDEPTSGLDPESILSVNGMIQTLAREEGTTIFLCTHQLRYAQEICSSYGLIDNGEILALGTLGELCSRVSKRMKLNIKTDTGLVTKDIQAEDEIPDIVQTLVKSGSKIYYVSHDELSLEDIYFSLIESKERGR